MERKYKSELSSSLYILFHLCISPSSHMNFTFPCRKESIISHHRGGNRNQRRGTSPNGPVVKNLPPNAGDVGSIPGRGTKIPHASGQLSLHTAMKTYHSAPPPTPQKKTEGSALLTSSTNNRSWIQPQSIEDH